MNIVSIKEFYDGYKKKGRDLPIEMVFDEFCSELSGLKIINFCLVYEGDDKLEFIKNIARPSRDIYFESFDSRNLKIIDDDAFYCHDPSIKGRCIALLSDDDLLRMMSILISKRF